MTKLYFMPLIILLSFSLCAQVNGVGIGTPSPQQKLHLASPTGTIRVDGLNSTNNSYNGGGIDKTYPVYVNENGDLTLNLSTFQNSDGTDAITSSTPLASTSISMTGANLPSGYQDVVILPYTVTVNRTAILEVKYNISFQVMKDVGTKIKDNTPRMITTFYTLDTSTLASTTPRYGQASKCFYNNNDLSATTPNSASEAMYNCSTTYIKLSPGTHTLRFYGTLNTGTNSVSTQVNFAVGNDSVFMRLY